MQLVKNLSDLKDIYILADGLTGPFIDENTFKQESIKILSRSTGYSAFCIETEETEPGFPDVLLSSLTKPTIHIEYKISDDKGMIKFKHTQPLWYMQNKHKVHIIVLAWDRRYSQTVMMPASVIADFMALEVKIPSQVSKYVKPETLLQ